ncbi:MAG: transaldolase [Hydrogenophilaceae bacterium]|nr:transaldolase [Hydrogenophilaceae bacterium]
MTAYAEFNRLGQSLWLDNLSRSLLKEGGLARYVEAGVSGVTSNPTIFHKAVSDSPYYKDDLARLKAREPDPEARYEALVVEDIRAACDLLKPVHDASAGDDGYVSLEVAPRLAHDAAATVAEAKRLSALVGRENLLIKVPATPAGASAFEQLTAEGYRLNITLLFSIEQTLRVFDAYLRGARAWLAKGGDPRRLKAVASLFLSRVDTLADKRLEAIGTEEALSLRGKTAVAMAKNAYRRYQELFHGPAFADLKLRGVRPQYLLWASTGTKNPAYSDLLYVEPLVGAETINTLPDKTLAAVADHALPKSTIEQGSAEAATHLARLQTLGIAPEQLGEELQVEGLRLFSESFDQMIDLMR